MKDEELHHSFSVCAVVSGRGGEGDGVWEHAAAGGDALAAVPPPRPHLRSALWTAQRDRAETGRLVSGWEEEQFD